MRIVVGLGNPGARYRLTRHNVGLLVAEELVRRHGAGRGERRSRAAVDRIRVGGEDVLVARPSTFMNRSGAAVAELLESEGAEARDLLIVCDDLYLDFEMVRIRPRGSHGGHRGLGSIIERLGTDDFARLRVGVGPAEPDIDQADFVLTPFPEEQRRRLPEVVGRAADCAETALLRGLERAMNRFNRRRIRDSEAGAEPPEGRG
ncbi:MAG: aminoacyl-tRNA hydrolase [Acidobacteriota bacterium]